MAKEFDEKETEKQFPPMRLVGADDAGRSVALEAYLTAMRTGVAEIREQGDEPDLDLLSEVASDIAQEIYDSFLHR